MIGHLLKLVWRRKRSTGLILAEIFLSFLVVFLVATLGLYFAGNYRRPLGYDYSGVWMAQIDSNTDLEDKVEKSAYLRDLDRILREIRQMDQVEAAAPLNLVPYDNGRWTWTQDLEDGRAVSFDLNQAGEGLPEVLRFRLERGRWFEDGDAALGWHPVVVNASLAAEIFGAEDPIGRRIPFKDWKEKEVRVVGIVSAFRKDGELSPSRNYFFQRAMLETLNAAPPRSLVLKVRAGTPAVFEEALVRRLQALAPSWTIETKTLEEMREAYLRKSLVPLALIGTVAGFLMLMVALGLTGVLWQNVTQRRQEIGLRRAVGAAARRIHRQILMELMLMTSLAVLLGLALVLQLPVLRLDMIRIGPGLMAAGAAVAAGLIYLLAALCGWYPSWFATRIHPVEALHYD